ncbi:maleylpyruvate isomerase family mycothiol-dependent enzyme [Pseudonocardia nantongensis]|uniref:maleylpyruvate isomerase family mycothiol-dependent enzyme n=1 Tax=Pseudonocardia nantongensis TaxID=1181885 RepID=UPI00397BAE23
MEMARQERSELADFLGTLPLEAWEQPSLCAGWRVRDVVAHIVSYQDLDRAGMAGRLLRARFRPSRLNEVGVEGFSTREPAELVGLLRARLEPHGVTATRGGGVGLVDGLVHHQDIRRPLGLAREVPVERLAYALPFARTAPPLRGFWHGRGVRLVATDVDWSAGRGPEARGPAEAVLMTLAGRRGVARELSGPGRDVLVRRLG